MADPTATELLRKHASASSVLSVMDTQVVERLAECSKAFLALKAKTLICQHSEEPILVSYSSDGTPLTTKETFTRGVGRLRVTRKGGSVSEYLTQRMFVQIVDGQRVIVFKDPVKLEDKRAICLLTAACNFFETPRELGHIGLCVSHFCWDRAIYSAMDRLLKQLHMFQAKHIGSSMEAGAGKLLHLKKWQFSSACCNHDCHNALRWGSCPLSRTMRP